MMFLKSPLFFGNPRLEAAAINRPALKRGDANVIAVQRLQAALLELGFHLPRSCRRGIPDGLFWTETYNAVIAFQKTRFHSDPSQWDGAAGRNTLGAMDKLLLTNGAGFYPRVDLLGPSSSHGLCALCLNPGKTNLPSFANVAGNIFLKPHGPTVVCDEKGGYRVDMAGTEGFIIARCVQAHEESHMEDLKKTCPDGCKGQIPGTPHPIDATRCPAFKDVLVYNEWRRKSECKAHKISLVCLKKLLATTTKVLDKALIKGAIKADERSLLFTE